MAEDAMNRIAREVYAKQQLGTNQTANVMPGDISRFLAAQSWFIRDPARRGDNFPLAVRHLLVPREYRREFFARELRPFNGTSAGYFALARMAQRSLWRTALTTNFDGCIVDALNSLTPHVARPIEINRTLGDHGAFALFSAAPQVVYLHGAIDAYTDLNTDTETEQPMPELAQLLYQLLASCPLVVVGYRGGENSIMSGLFGALRHRTGDFRSGVYWCDLGRVPLHPNVDALKTAIGSNFISLTIDGFDELLTDLNDALASQDIYAAIRPQRPASRLALPSSISIEDLDQELILAKLVEYCATVGRPKVDRTRMWGLLGEMGLVFEDPEGRVSPTTEGFLLFGKDVHAVFPQACVDLTFSGKKRQLIKGNLVEQFVAIQSLLDSTAVNPELRVKTTTSSKRRRAYNERSVTEMVVNLLVHRDYGIEEPSRIDIEEGVRIKFTNPGGLPDAPLKRFAPGPSGEFVPVRSVTEIRNYAIADLFYGIGPMDKRGSGLCDARDFMLENGGSTRYAIERNNVSFIAELLQPRQKAPGTSETAVALHPFGVYLTNHLRLEVLPTAVTLIDQKGSPNIAVSTGHDLLGSPTAPGSDVVIRQRERYVTFCHPRDVSARPGTFRTQDVDYFRQQPGGHSTLSHLLREHFVRYLSKFHDGGLVVEPGGHRAYFVKQGDDAVKIKYDGAKRSGIEREMVKRRELRNEIYHENEGIAFDVVWFQATWAMEIKPFYMFTGPDGRTPLPPHRRGRLSTSRMRFDRNPNVASDLTFWARFLSGSSEAVQLCPTGKYDLLMSGTFHSVEIADPDLEKVA